jgi:hypothetical protein
MFSGFGSEKDSAFKFKILFSDLDGDDSRHLHVHGSRLLAEQQPRKHLQHGTRSLSSKGKQQCFCLLKFYSGANQFSVMAI